VGEFACSDYSKSGTNINRSELFSDKPHIKLNVIKKLIQLAYEKDYQLSFLSIVDINIISKLEELNRVRNLFSHISALSEDQARQMISENLDKPDGSASQRRR
jgi:hypothetical protein